MKIFNENHDINIIRSLTGFTLSFMTKKKKKIRWDALTLPVIGKLKDM